MIKTPQDMFEEKQRNIEKRIDIKDKSIAYFNSLNAAISRCPTGKLEEILEWRDKFYSEWEKWYKDTTAIKINELTDEQRVEAVKKFEANYRDMSKVEEIKAEELEVNDFKENLPIINSTDL